MINKYNFHPIDNSFHHNIPKLEFPQADKNNYLDVFQLRPFMNRFQRNFNQNLYKDFYFEPSNNIWCHFDLNKIQ